MNTVPKPAVTTCKLSMQTAIGFYRSTALVQTGIPAVAPSLLRKPLHQDARVGKRPFRFVSARIDVHGGRVHRPNRHADS